MIGHNFAHASWFDDTWRRWLWVMPTAVVVWALLLFAFTLMLHGTRRPIAPIERLDARLIEVAPPEPPAGLAGTAAEPEAAPPASPPPPIAQPERRKPHPAVHPKHKAEPVPPRLYDARGAHTAPVPESTESTATGSAGGNGVPTSGGGGSHGGGLGTASTGARAIYAPSPAIPNDLRHEVFEAVAVAHFHVTFDGTATVSLTQPTSNPHLNALLLATLRQWRFFPAVRNGIAVDSDFDVRIPITVQ